MTEIKKRLFEIRHSLLFCSNTQLLSETYLWYTLSMLVPNYFVFYVRVTVHRNKFLYNKVLYMLGPGVA